MSHVAEVQLRPAFSRRLLAPLVALFLVAALVVVLLATAGSGPSDRSTPAKSTGAVEAGTVPASAAQYWFGRGRVVPKGAAPRPR